MPRQVPTATRHFHVWGQDVCYQGPVKITRGSVYIQNKPVLELSKVTDLPERSNSVAVRLQLENSDWLEVIFDTSCKAEAFRRDAGACMAKMRARTARTEKSKVDKENLIVKLPIDAASKQAGDKGTRHPLKRLPQKRTVGSTPGEALPSKALRRETPEKVPMAVVSESRESEESFVDMVKSWMKQDTHALEPSSLHNRDSVHSLELGDSEERLNTYSTTQVEPAWPDTELDRTEEWMCEKYDFGAVLEKSTSSEVCVATHKESGRELVLKIINKLAVKNWLVRSNSSELTLRSEAELMKDLKHPHIIELHDVFETEMHTYLIMEYAPGGDLLKYLIKHGHLTEDIARRLFYELCDAVRYLHSTGVVHRDLKLSNILLTDLNPKSAHVKVADLGVSRKAERSCECQTFCGTLDYIAPEVAALRTQSRNTMTNLPRPLRQTYRSSCPEDAHRGGYGRPADMWSLGVILYMMLCGRPPFDGHQGDTRLCQQIESGKWEFDGRPWTTTVSSQAMDLISKLLVQDPRNRFTIEEVFQHSWLHVTGS